MSWEAKEELRTSLIVMFAIANIAMCFGLFIVVYAGLYVAPISPTMFTYKAIIDFFPYKVMWCELFRVRW
jgi:hypothetical protein